MNTKMNNNNIKYIALCIILLFLNGCGIYKSYTRPEIKTEGIYRDIAITTDTFNTGNIQWKELFTDVYLQQLIEQGLEHNTNMQNALLNIEKATAALTHANLSFLPSVAFSPEGVLSSFGGSKTVKSYSIPLTVSWELDAFGRINNARKRSKAFFEQSLMYRQFVRTQLIASIANTYYTLLLLDAQLEISQETIGKWAKNVETMQALKQAGMTNESAVSQAEANYFHIRASALDLQRQICEVENSLSVLLYEAPHAIKRGKLSEQHFPEHIKTGIPVQVLSNRPDVKIAELSLMQSFYTTAEARSAFYPALRLNGNAGWTNTVGEMIINPGKLLWAAVGSLAQPVFQQGAIKARLKISQVEEQQMKLHFQQTVLNAGNEVVNALKQVETAHEKATLLKRETSSLEKAVQSTQYLMRNSNTTYLEVLTAQMSLLNAQISHEANRFEEIQGIIYLYHALGGGSE